MTPLRPFVLDVLDAAGRCAVLHRRPRRPALYQDVATGQYRLARFNSVWQRGEDGVWRVVFDDGLAPRPAEAGHVEAFHAGRVTGCPPE
jgi:hypothetical protein